MALTFGEPCVFMEATRVQLPAGGWQTAWSDGAEFEAEINFDNSVPVRVAGAAGVQTAYTVSVTKDIPLATNNYIKRLKTGEYLKTNNQPAVAHDIMPSILQKKQFSAEHVDALPG